MMTIYEPPVRNSGIIGGKFLERTRVAKPSSAPDQPTFYGPQDFYIGAVVDIFKHRFVIISADEYVLKYMEEHKSQFPGMLTSKLQQLPASVILLQLYCSLYQIDPYTRTLYLVVYPSLLDNLFLVLIFSSTVIISNPMYHYDFRGHHSDTPGSSGPSESSERNDQRWTHES